jgi:hypothetical protein
MGPDAGLCFERGLNPIPAMALSIKHLRLNKADLDFGGGAKSQS